MIYKSTKIYSFSDKCTISSPSQHKAIGGPWPNNKCTSHTTWLAMRCEKLVSHGGISWKLPFGVHKKNYAKSVTIYFVGR